MLVLTRKLGEGIVVPDCSVVLTVLSIRGGRVQLGISAPAALPIERAVNRQRQSRGKQSPPRS